MATYAIGDVQGCYDALGRLLDALRFDATRDRLLFTGDLVNRGPHSLEVLRLVFEMGDRAVTVLGNHDLHLLAVAAGAARPSSEDTLDDVLNAHDRDHLLRWLSCRPLMHQEPNTDYVLIHAGLLPQWDIPQAASYAREAEATLRGQNASTFYQRMYGNEPSLWTEELQGADRVRLIVNALTRLRYCYPDGRAEYRHKGRPGTQPAPLVPWFAVPGRRSRSHRVVCGHWSLLGLWKGDGVVGIDTGCGWGGKLSAIQLIPDQQDHWSVECHNNQ